jgi:single stranded DNA-binding protein
MSELRCHGVCVVVADAELRDAGKSQLCKVNAVFKKPFKDNNGEWQSEDSFIALKAWGPKAVKLAEAAKKGTVLAVDGRAVQETWETKANEKRTTVVMQVESFEVCNSSKSEGNAPVANTAQSKPSAKKTASAPTNKPKAAVAVAEPEETEDEECPF